LSERQPQPVDAALIERIWQAIRRRRAELARRDAAKQSWILSATPTDYLSGVYDRAVAEARAALTAADAAWRTAQTESPASSSRAGREGSETGGA
jgi:malate synthase